MFDYISIKNTYPKMLLIFFKLSFKKYFLLNNFYYTLSNNGYKEAIYYIIQYTCTYTMYINKYLKTKNYCSYFYSF